MEEAVRSSALKKMRHKATWLLAQAVEYDSGRPESGTESGTENGIVAALRCAQMAASYRRQADNLAIFIAAAEEADA
jgi:hypothetical protein